MNPIKAILADDHALVREGLKQILEFDGSLEIIGEASNGQECIDLLQSTTPDIVLLDINMPVLNGLDVIEILHKKSQFPKILLLTVHNEIEYVIRAIELGINGYILKDADSKELINAIHLIIEGENYIEPSLIPEMDKKIMNRASDSEKIQALTKREIEILKLLSKGLINRDIANELFISERTVKNHVSNIFKKIDVNDRTQAALFSIKNDLIRIE